MKNSLLFLATIFMLHSCVELPNLLPNGSGEDSDMVIVEYNDLLKNLVTSYNLASFDDTLVVDDMLSIRFYFNTPGTSCNGSYEMHMVNGHLLKVNSGGNEFQFLTEGDLVGGIVEGTWGNNGVISVTQDFYAVCIKTFHLPENKDAVVGIRFKDNLNKWHYGWVVFYLDTTGPNEELYLKAVGYNKLPGTNVRIGS